MKYLKLFLISALLFLNAKVYAGGVGYIDYQKVLENYQFAKTTLTEIQNKHNEIEKYLEQKEIEFNRLETPLQKQKFEATVQNELRTKENAFNDFRNKKEEAVYTRIHAVSEKIRLEKGFDAILDMRSVFSGGIDITDELIKTLNSGGGIRQ
jgi:Skp family chaperone for outer membrane proteins